MNFSSAIYRWSQIVTGYNTMKETLVVKLLLCNLIIDSASRKLYYKFNQKICRITLRKERLSH